MAPTSVDDGAGVNGDSAPPPTPVGDGDAGRESTAPTQPDAVIGDLGVSMWTGPYRDPVVARAARVGSGDTAHLEHRDDSTPAGQPWEW